MPWLSRIKDLRCGYSDSLREEALFLYRRVQKEVGGGGGGSVKTFGSRDQVLQGEPLAEPLSAGSPANPKQGCDSSRLDHDFEISPATDVHPLQPLCGPCSAEICQPPPERCV